MKIAILISLLTFITACQPHNEKSSPQDNELTRIKAENNKLRQQLKILRGQTQLAAVQDQLLKCQSKNRALSKSSHSESPTPKTELSPKPNLMKARKLLIMGQYEEVIKVSNRQLEMHPEMAPATKADFYRVLGIAYKRLKNKKKACFYLSKASNPKQFPSTNVDSLRNYMRTIGCKK